QDQAPHKCEVRCAEGRAAAVEDAPAQATAPVAARRAGTPRGLVQQESGIGKDGGHSKGSEETTALAVAAVAANAASACRAAHPPRPPPPPAVSVSPGKAGGGLGPPRAAPGGPPPGRPPPRPHSRGDRRHRPHRRWPGCHASSRS